MERTKAQQAVSKQSEDHQTDSLADVLSTISHCFAHVPQNVWEAEIQYGNWNNFLTGCRSALTPLDDRACVLENWISTPEVEAIKNPPSYEEKTQFASHHFVGGLPESAVPVESLYCPWSETDMRIPFAGEKGMYGGDSAVYMKSLIERMGMQVPKEFQACPDHLSLEADLAAVILRSGGEEQGHMFLGERFGWLTRYRLKLLRLGKEAYFYLAIVDVLSAISLRWAPDDDESEDDELEDKAS